MKSSYDLKLDARMCLANDNLVEGNFKFLERRLIKLQPIVLLIDTKLASQYTFQQLKRTTFGKKWKTLVVYVCDLKTRLIKKIKKKEKMNKNAVRYTLPV